MRLLVSLAFLLPAFAQTGTYFVCGDPSSWQHVLSAVNFSSAPRPNAAVVVCNDGPAGGANTLRVLVGDSPVSRQYGFHAGSAKITVRSVVDVRSPDLKIVWQDSVTIQQTEVPAEASVFVKERWSGVPLVAGLKTNDGPVLWLAVTPGEQGFERFPYLLQAMSDLGLQLPYHSRRLWAFFDSSYRSRVDVDYFAQRWRAAGIAALHVASWHYMEPTPGMDEYLRQLIAACHRQAIVVYAWIELPHVSEKFWDEHPEWREKTALLQDAHLDWRKLMNLSNPDCSKAAAERIRSMLERFDWDGANLGELYFESPLGYSNAARFTPLNDDVRAAFKQKRGFDPLEAFHPDSPRYHGRNAKPMRAFLDFRADLAFRLQAEWVGRLKEIQASKPDLDLVLTHVDDRLDQTMRDTIGADAPRTLAFAEGENVRFLIEDPATVWDRGPKRYTELQGLYAKIAKRQDLLSIDINIVDRYQDVYPTRQQTGLEFLQLVNLATRAFPQVALYFEASISKVDLPLLGSAATAVARDGEALVVQDRTGIRWNGPAEVNGLLWPFQDEKTLWLPSGKVTVRPAAQTLPFRLLDFSSDMTNARWQQGEFSWEYQSRTRAFLKVDRPVSITLDNGPSETLLGLKVVPTGKHRIAVSALRTPSD